MLLHETMLPICISQTKASCVAGRTSRLGLLFILMHGLQSHMTMATAVDSYREEQCNVLRNHSIAWIEKEGRCFLSPVMSIC